MTENLQLLSSSRHFDGWQQRYRHYSLSNNCTMNFAIYLPPKAEHEPVPVLYWLSGLTCTEENFILKAGAQRFAAELGMAIVCPDTSPRGTDLPGEHDNINIGSGAGFYLNATQEPWSQHYRMYDYVNEELPNLVLEHFPVTDRWSISGHSMGGMGALILALRNPGRFCSVSALAPISNPTASEKSRWRLKTYLGEDESQWQQYDPCCLIERAEYQQKLLVDQGDADEMIDGLMPHKLVEACEKANYPLDFHLRQGYDHGYYFVASFIESHLRFHARALSR